MFAFYKTWSQCWGCQGVSHLIELGLAKAVLSVWMTQISGLELLASLFLWFESHAMVLWCALLCLSVSSWRTGCRLALTTCFLFRQHFDMPHDIAASEDGTVYVGDAHANTVWKFTSTESTAYAVWLSTLFTQVYCLKTHEQKCACPSPVMVSSVGSQGVIQFTPVQFSCSVVSSSLQPQGMLGSC